MFMCAKIEDLVATVGAVWTSEAMDLLRWAMHSLLQWCSIMVTKIASKKGVF
jgi:hypothetical protein